MSRARAYSARPRASVWRPTCARLCRDAYGHDRTRDEPSGGVAPSPYPTAQGMSCTPADACVGTSAPRPGPHGGRRRPIRSRLRRACMHAPAGEECSPAGQAASEAHDHAAAQRVFRRRTGPSRHHAVDACRARCVPRRSHPRRRPVGAWDPARDGGATAGAEGWRASAARSPRSCPPPAPPP
jgi:hypothetical protein